MKSCIDCIKKYRWPFTFLFLIFLLYPLAMFSEFLWLHVVNVFSTIEEISKKYQNSFQMLQALGILGIILSWLKWKKDEKEKEERSLSSISIVEVGDDAVATIQNTSDNSILEVRVCRPDNFEKKSNEIEYKKYIADSEESYKERTSFLKNISNWKSIQWENVLTAKLFIGEKAVFHIKDVADEDGKYVHFAPIKIEIYLEDKNVQSKTKTKFVLFRYANKELRKSNEDFIANKLNPYGRWIRLM